MSSAGQVGGAVSPTSLLSLKVSSKPNPLGPSAAVNLTNTHKHTHTHYIYSLLYTWGLCSHCLKRSTTHWTCCERITTREGHTVPVLVRSSWYVNGILNYAIQCPNVHSFSECITNSKKRIPEAAWATGSGVFTAAYSLMNPVVPVQVTQSKADIVPVLLDVLSWTARVPVHTDVV